MCFFILFIHLSTGLKDFVHKVMLIQGRRRFPLSGYFVDNSFFDVFSFDLISGNPAKALEKPFSLVLTNSASAKLFGTRDPVGKIVKVSDLGDFIVTALMKDPPKFSHLRFEMLGSFSTVPILEKDSKLYLTIDNWESLNTSYVYTLLKPNVKPGELKVELDRISQEAYRNIDNVDATFDFQGINNIVPGPDLSIQIGPKMHYLPIIILSVLSLAILASACFNYTNLSVARAIKRAKEFGLRKVSGATRKQIFFQLISETLIISLLALIFSIIVFLLIRPGFLSIIPKASETLNMDLSVPLVIGFITYSVFAGVMAGMLPAIYFSRISPLKALRESTFLKVLTKMDLRKVLITAQFALSLFFITGMVIISKQYRFSLNYDFGFTSENILNVPLSGVDPEILRTEFSKIPEVTKISMSSLILGMGLTSGTWIRPVDSMDSILAFFISVDHTYIDNLGLNLMSGRNFNEEFAGYGESVAIVNQEFLKAFSITSTTDVIDKVYTTYGEDLKIIGVIKDFHYNHLEEPIEPFFLHYDPDRFRYAHLSIVSTDMPKTMEKIEQAWEATGSKSEFKATFFEDDIQEAYGFLVNIMKLFGFIGIVAITIAILGLLGMAVYNTETRLKEIGIRKILGASNLNLVVLLSKGFLKMLIIAALIALPATFLLFDKVILALHFYRPEISLWDLLLSSVLLTIIGLFTVGFQTLRGARTNPAESLRNE